MALVLNDRVKETTTSTGTGTINLAGAETGFETFVAGVGNSNTCYYCIAHQSANEFEVGLGTITDATPDTLARTTIISSSNSDSAVDFSAGTKDVFCTLPASKAVVEDGSDNIALGAAPTISNASGDLTLDIVGSIVLDADNNAEISFQDAGTEIGKIFNSSSDFALEAGVQDKDIIFRGNDGGTGITALTLDMSDAGRAMFNGSIDVGGTSITRTGDLTLDGSGDIILDAGGEHIRFYDDGNEWGNIESGSSNFNLTASVQDKDFVFLGNDGGSGIIAARIDMSDSGALICNGNITAFGSTSDIRLKENVEVIPDALDKVKQLKGITFNYKKDGKKSTGLIAQDLEKVLPEAVYETSDVDDEDKHLAIRYGNTVGLLVEAIKEQQEQIETLTAKVKELENR
tara:strand:- start:1136 stop:2341 length:1206 start_codon:yes stop_codon:yes gene_type:complete